MKFSRMLLAVEHPVSWHMPSQYGESHSTRPDHHALPVLGPARTLAQFRHSHNKPIGGSSGCYLQCLLGDPHGPLHLGCHALEATCAMLAQARASQSPPYAMSVPRIA
eukprot:1236637-Rhodomonas_salina.4